MGGGFHRPLIRVSPPLRLHPGSEPARRNTANQRRPIRNPARGCSGLASHAAAASWRGRKSGRCRPHSGTRLQCPTPHTCGVRANTGPVLGHAAGSSKSPPRVHEHSQARVHRPRRARGVHNARHPAPPHHRRTLANLPAAPLPRLGGSRQQNTRPGEGQPGRPAVRCKDFADLSPIPSQPDQSRKRRSPSWSTVASIDHPPV